MVEQLALPLLYDGVWVRKHVQTSTKARNKLKNLVAPFDASQLYLSMGTRYKLCMKASPIKTCSNKNNQLNGRGDVGIKHAKMLHQDLRLAWSKRRWVCPKASVLRNSELVVFNGPMTKGHFAKSKCCICHQHE